MIAAVLIIGLFVGGIAALAWHGTRVRNPADLEVSFEDHLGIMRNEFMALAKVMGEQLLPAMDRAVVALNKLRDALATSLDEEK